MIEGNYVGLVGCLETLSLGFRVYGVYLGFSQFVISNLTFSALEKP